MKIKKAINSNCYVPGRFCQINVRSMVTGFGWIKLDPEPKIKAYKSCALKKEVNRE